MRPVGSSMDESYIHKGLTVGRIVLIALGIFILSNNIQRCQSFTGELGQFLDTDARDVCDGSAAFIVMSLVGIIAGIIMIVIGGDPC